MFLAITTVFAEAKKDANDLVIAQPSATSNGCNLANAGIKDKQEFLRFFDTVKRAAADNDKETLSTMLHYPIWVYLKKNKRKPIRNEKEFKTYYRKILNKKILDVLLKQKQEDLFCNYQGVMLGDGAVWFGLNSEKQLGIKAINN